MCFCAGNMIGYNYKIP